MTGTTKYYALRFSSGPPLAVLRFFDDGVRSPQRFNGREKSWVVDERLHRWRQSHDFDPSDEIDEEEANQIIERLKAQGPVTR